MSIQIPGPVRDLMSLYGIPWPDVDEDAFHDLKAPLEAFGVQMQRFGNELFSALRTLGGESNARVITAIGWHVNFINDAYIARIQDVCHDLAGWPCDAAYDAIVALKLALISTLAAEVADDAIAGATMVLTLGLDSPLALAEMVAVREEVSVMLQTAEGVIGDALQSAAQSVIDNFVSSVVTPFVQWVTNEIERPIDALLPGITIDIENFADGAVPGFNDGAGITHNEEALAAALVSVGQSGHTLDEATAALKAAVEAIFEVPDPSSYGLPSVSDVLRKVLESVASTVVGILESAVKHLVDNVVHHVIHLLEDFRKMMQELDQLAADLAHKEKVAMTMPVHVIAATGLGESIGATVAVASGLVDAEEADSVREERAVAVGFDARTSGQTAKVEAVDAQATEVDQAIEELVPTDKAAKVSLDAARSTSQSIDELLAKADPNLAKVQLAGSTPDATGTVTSKVQAQGSPVAGTAQAPAGGPAGLAAGHRDQHTPKVQAAHQTGTGPQHLEVKHDEHDAPKTSGVTAAAAQVEDVKVPEAGTTAEAEI